MVTSTDNQVSQNDEHIVVSQTPSLDHAEVSQTLEQVAISNDINLVDNDTNNDFVDTKPLIDQVFEDTQSLQTQVAVSHVVDVQQAVVTQHVSVQHAVVVSHPIDSSVPVVCITEHPASTAVVTHQQISQSIEHTVQTIEAVHVGVCISHPDQTLACMNSVKQLDIGDAIRFLENVEQYPHINLPPVKPKAGEVYLFRPTALEEQGNEQNI